MKKNKQPRNIKFNPFSLVNFSLELNLMFILEKLGLIEFKSMLALFLTVTAVFLLRGAFDLLLAFFRQKDPAILRLRSRNTKHYGWLESFCTNNWGAFAPMFSIVAVFIFFAAAITKLEWLSVLNIPYGWPFLVSSTCVVLEQYWYFYNNPTTT